MFRQIDQISSILLEAITEAVIIVDNHQKIMEVNNSAVDMFGHSKDDIIGRDFNILLPSNYHKDHTDFFNEFLKDSTRKRMSESKDIYGLKKDGDIIELDIELIPFSIYSRTYVMALIKDISSQIEIERNLMIKSRALESATNGIVITDALKLDNPIIYFNAAFQNITGYSSEEILNHNCRFLYDNDLDQEPLNKLKEAIKEGESCRALLRNYKKDGTLFWNNLFVMPIKDNEGLLTNFIGIHQDITDRINEEQTLQHFATIFDESLNEIHVFDAKTLKFINVNYGGQKNIGYTMDELSNMTPLDILPYLDEAGFNEIVNVLFERNVEKIEIESVHRRKDGSTYPVETHLQLSKIGDREVFVAIILDITERKNYTKKLENKVDERTKQLKVALRKEIELNELKTKFLSLLSHEFKTPLSAILTSALLLSRYQLTEQQENRNKHIRTIIDKAKLLNNILTGFLSIERFEAGNISYQFSNFKISGIVNNVIYNAKMLLKDGQQIKYRENIDDLSLYQDEKIVELILTNLIHNAIKYSPENSSIYVDIEQNEEQTIIKITDTGIGIPEKDQRNIFDLYFRAENVINTEGTGIGLNIVKNHLDSLNGSISFESKEHLGTTFTVSIPNTAKS
ncbi:PAS domain S-box protein [Gaetbulibacter sp. M235]|uniref:PAS domain-containing sensor histidine kinase n=1 Tax=Gaetbulibacter sp. M235 TaxID=3126510 RepID=UPI00374F97A8